jgi:uncharacterized repeat protein (TIGR01451 family)
VITTFRVSNTGNSTQGYQLAVANETGTTVFTQVDNQDVTNLRVFVDDGDGVYDAGDTLTNIDSLATDADGESVLVFVLANIPVAASNAQYANVRLTARAAVAGTNGGTLATESGGADNPAAVDIVFADAARDATESAADQYAIVSAALTVTKTVAVVSDPFNLTGPDRKAIPGAVVEYTITVTNGSTTTAATGVELSDQIPTNTTYLPNSLTLNSAALTDSGADADAGRYENAPTPRVVVTAGAVAASGGTAVVTFQVTINN